MSEGGPTALGDPGSQRHNIDGWMLGAEDVDNWGSQVGQRRTVQDFITLLKMVCNLKIRNFFSGIFHLLSSDYGWPQIIVTTERKTMERRDYCALNSLGIGIIFYQSERKQNKRKTCSRYFRQKEFNIGSQLHR